MGRFPQWDAGVHMTFIRTLVVLLLVSSGALAQEAPSVPVSEVKDIPPGEDMIVPVAAGEKAPFQGQLFSPETALRWANWLEQYQQQKVEDNKLQQKVCTAELDYQGRRRQLELEAAGKVEKDLRARVLIEEKKNVELQEELRNPPFLKSRTFSAIIGVAGGALLTGLAATVVIEVSKD